MTIRIPETTVLTAIAGDRKSLDVVNDGKNNDQPILADTGSYAGQLWKIVRVN